MTFLNRENGSEASADLFRLVVENVTDYAIFLLDLQGNVTSWNPGAERIKGYTADEIIGQHFSKFYPQEAIDRHWPEHELKVAAAEGRFEDEGWRIRKDGSRFWANVVITALKDAYGKLLGFSKITRDLTARKAAEENARRLAEETAARRVAEEDAKIIREQRERLQITLASIGDAVISTDQYGRVGFLNPVAEKLVGWTTAEAAGRSLEEVFQIVNETTRQSVENPAARALEQGTIVGLANHTVLISRDGTERPIDDSAAPIRDAAGNIIGSILVFRDIGERKRAEKALHEQFLERQAAEDEQRQSEQELADFFENATIGLHCVGPEGTILRANRAELEMLGYTRDEYIGQRIADFHVDEEVIRDIMQRLQAGERLHEYPARLLCKDKSIKDVLIDSSVLFRNGEFVHTRCFTRDVTVQKRAEQTSRFLADASAALAVLVDFDSTLQKVASLAVPHFADWVAVDVLEADGSLRRVAVAHVDPAKVELGRDLQKRFPSDPSTSTGVWKIISTGQAEIVPEITDEMLVGSIKDDSLLSIMRQLGLKSYIGVPLTVRGKMMGVLTFIIAESGHVYDDMDLAVAKDLASRAAIAIENTQLYRELREADRRKDEFLAMLAHELRNPLAPIRNGLQVLKLSGTGGEMVDEARAMMERQLGHMVRLVDDLLDVSRITRNKLELRKERVSLATIIHAAVETSLPMIEQFGHTFSMTLTPSPVYFDADPVRLAQVFSNLLNNAAKYTEPGGKISLMAEVLDSVAVVRVQDNGLGISADAQPRIFEMFSQVDLNMERAQGGLGIGLTLVRRLAEMHGGTVDVHSDGPGKGSEFTVRIPVFNEVRPNSAGSNTGAGTALSLKRKILVVDDNRDAAESLGMMLRLMGNEVRTAEDGLSALNVAEEYRPNFILLDIGLPKLNGYDTCRRIRDRQWSRDTVIVALTGWGQPEDRRRSQEAGFDHHLVKPIDAADLSQLLSQSPRER